MSVSTSQFSETGVPRVPVGDGIEVVFDWVDDNLGGFFRSIRDLILGATDGLADGLNAPAPLVLVVLFAALAWLVKDWKFALVSFIGLAFVISVDQWENAMTTLSLVLIATIIALVIAIPVGIAAARSPSVSNAVRPVMDLMQTMPAFVWLVPVVTLFSIGVAGGVVATVIFALPPGVRLTELGIRQVDAEVVEAGHAFGSSPGQILRGIQIPLALPTIMAGVNQVIMLALSMAVIAGLVGAGGLGGAVTSSISQLDIGLGFEAGLSVVVLAIYLDRTTAAVGGGAAARARRITGGFGRMLGRSRTTAAPVPAGSPT
ncbi:ABC transporter permease subunit [Arthrobacter echini]|uniref:ABC transporter permease subunit n=1 Tax=Arthrobacter echini TaxID=1529066 RepID=A0A5D0XSI6_9MICC|nr:ABC transporter permease subunit [Arthrobacter echini]TYC99450.1 ABC transporter permease subunit [Arthrobacter echini]